MDNSLETPVTMKIIQQFNVPLDRMLAKDMRSIDEKIDVTMLQSCDISCLRSLP